MKFTAWGWKVQDCIDSAAVAFRVSMLSVVAGPSLAQSGAEANFPARPLRIVVGFTPGGQPDITARLIAPKLYEVFRQQVVVDNRPGAGGVIGTQIVRDANPDGHTLLSISASHVISPAVRKLPYDPLRDFAGVTKMYSSSYVLLVSPSLGPRSVQELISLAKAKPGQLNFSSAGVGSATHFAGEVLKQVANIDVVHVPYKGIPESITDVITGRVQFTLPPLASSLMLIKENKVRALGVSTAKRVALHPELPTIAESGLPGFAWDSWGGIIAPAKTPAGVIRKLNRALVGILKLPDIEQRCAGLTLEPAPTTPADFDRFLADQIHMVAALARKAG
ncbi:MAG TPA: tripartite tricarboxylate transporter substrate binding protein, partial [Burkholderiales bacterium]|nr:tripartite tricarboxylate transporter substrate binding protein [Burkholderiales bacterium]